MKDKWVKHAEDHKHWQVVASDDPKGIPEDESLRSESELVKLKEELDHYLRP